jgi:hypothetical protein
MSVVYRRFIFTEEWNFTVPVAGGVESPGAVTLGSSAAAQSFLISWSGRSVLGRVLAVVWVGFYPTAATAAPVRGFSGPGYIAYANDGSFDLGPYIFSSIGLCQVGRALGCQVAFYDLVCGKISGRVGARCVVEP